MHFSEPEVIDLDQLSLEAALECIPDSPAVFLIEPRAGEPYIGRTSLLRRRLRSLLRQRTFGSRTLNLAGVSTRALYWPVLSQLGGSLIHFEVTRRAFPTDYSKRLRLPSPAYIKLLKGNEYPRSQVTNRPASGRSQWYGPFRTRAEADLFESEMLDLFAIRRCQEDLEPSLDHPGCIYGEMGKCLRPCQRIVDRRQYLMEVDRVASFLSSRGSEAMEESESAREQASAEMDFEAAGVHHRRLERIRELIRSSGELPRDLKSLHGIAIAPGKETLELWPMREGIWQRSVPILSLEPPALEAYLREALSQAPRTVPATGERSDHLALLSRWYHSSWKEGEWFPIDAITQIPWKSLMRRIGKAATGYISA